MIFSQELKLILNSFKVVPYLKHIEWFSTRNEHREVVDFRLVEAVNIEHVEEA